MENQPHAFDSRRLKQWVHDDYKGRSQPPEHYWSLLQQTESQQDTVSESRLTREAISNRLRVIRLWWAWWIRDSLHSVEQEDEIVRAVLHWDICFWPYEYIGNRLREKTEYNVSVHCKDNWKLYSCIHAHLCTRVGARRPRTGLEDFVSEARISWCLSEWKC